MGSFSGAFRNSHAGLWPVLSSGLNSFCIFLEIIADTYSKAAAAAKKMKSKEKHNDWFKCNEKGLIIHKYRGANWKSIDFVLDNLFNRL